MALVFYSNIEVLVFYLLALRHFLSICCLAQLVRIFCTFSLAHFFLHSRMKSFEVLCKRLNISFNIVQ